MPQTQPLPVVWLLSLKRCDADRPPRDLVKSGIIIGWQAVDAAAFEPLILTAVECGGSDFDPMARLIEGKISWIATSSDTPVAELVDQAVAIAEVLQEATKSETGDDQPYLD